MRGWVSEWGVKLLSYVNRVPPFSSALLLDLCAIAVCVCVPCSEQWVLGHCSSPFAMSPIELTCPTLHCGWWSLSLSLTHWLHFPAWPLSAKKNLLFLSSFYSDELSTVVHCRFIFIFSGLNIQRPVKGHEHKRGKMFSTLDFCISGLFFIFFPISHSLFFLLTESWQFREYIIFGVFILILWLPFAFFFSPCANRIQIKLNSFCAAVTCH